MKRKLMSVMAIILSIIMISSFFSQTVFAYGNNEIEDEIYHDELKSPELLQQELDEYTYEIE